MPKPWERLKIPVMQTLSMAVHRCCSACSCQQYLLPQKEHHHRQHVVAQRDAAMLQHCAPASAPTEQHQPPAPAHTGLPAPRLPAKRSRWAPWIHPCTALQNCQHPAPRSFFPGTARASLAHWQVGFGADGGSVVPQSVCWSWVGWPVLGDTFWADMCPLGAALSCSRTPR